MTTLIDSIRRQRIQQQTLHRRGHAGDPLYGIRRIARTRLQLLSTRQYARLTGVFDADEHLAVQLANPSIAMTSTAREKSAGWQAVEPGACGRHDVEGVHHRDRVGDDFGGGGLVARAGPV
jgi:hypothetical protein